MSDSRQERAATPGERLELIARHANSWHHDDEAKRLSEALELALARLREGTEVLRTGGGTSLTAEQCNLLLDDRAELVERLEQVQRALREIDTYACYGTPWNAYVDVKRIAKEALATQQREK